MEKEYELVSWSGHQMGGRTEVAILAETPRRAVASETARRAGQRIQAWANKLTRFDPKSDLSRLNGSTTLEATVAPTLASALAWARVAVERTDGLVDPTLLDARMAAEEGVDWSDGSSAASRSWTLRPARRGAVVQRRGTAKFDLDGIAKGWLADRAANLLDAWPAVSVDADGDVSVRLDAGMEWQIDVGDPRSSIAAPLASLRLTGGPGWTTSYGVATSGTSVHRWGDRHHLIDPGTGLSAETDVVQATVLAPSASEAEVLAKAAVIRGSDDGLAFLGRSAAYAAVLLLDTDVVIATPDIERWLA